MPPVTNQTCRKSTARRSPPTRTPLRPIARDDSRNVFGNAEDRLGRGVERRNTTFAGPVGLGVGKGGIRRIMRINRRVVPTRRQIERQATINDGNSIPLMPFARVVRQILNRIAGEGKYKLQAITLRILKEISETYLVNFFDTCNLFVIHNRRVTLMPRDIDLYHKIKRQADFNGQVAGTGGRANSCDSRTE